MARTPRKPGRPAARKHARDAREALIGAASALFGARGADAVSVREIAETAQVSAAMVHYYFKDKRGLMLAVLDRGLERILDVVTESVAQAEGPVTRTFVDRYIRALNAEPWLPQLIVREVLPTDSPYQQVFIQRFVHRAVELMPPRIAEDIAAGRLRSDLDPRFTMMSLVGMCMFPFLVRPLLWPILGYENTEAFAGSLVEHTNKLFHEGAVPGK